MRASGFETSLTQEMNTVSTELVVAILSYVPYRRLVSSRRVSGAYDDEATSNAHR